MAQFLGFGDGHDGSVATSGAVNSYATCTASADSNTVTTSLSVAEGDMVLLHQSQGSNPGDYELVQVASTGSGEFTTTNKVANDYVSGSQAVLVPQYTNGTITGAIGGTPWDGSKGGIIAMMVNGALTITGSVSASGLGFRGASSITSGGSVGRQGEGQLGWAHAQSTNNQGNGGGGGGYSTNNPWNQGNGAGGGGNGGDGAGGRGTGGGNNSGGGGGTRGIAAGLSDGTKLVFGGGGGSGGMGSGNSGTSGSGNRGGGFIIIWARTIVCTAGTITSPGGAGSSAAYPLGCGGGGAGGSIVIYTENGTFGTNKVTANGAIGGCVENNCTARVDGRGGPGGGGRIIIKSCAEDGSYTVSSADYSAYTPSDTGPVSSAGSQNVADGGQTFCYTMPSAVI